MNDQALLQEALQEAKQGLREGGLPIGSVLANQQGQIVARGHNLRVQSGDPTAHSERGPDGPCRNCVPSQRWTAAGLG